MHFNKKKLTTNRMFVMFFCNINEDELQDRSFVMRSTIPWVAQAVTGCLKVVDVVPNDVFHLGGGFLYHLRPTVRKIIRWIERIWYSRIPYFDILPYICCRKA
jgi:hypothetical protein